LGRESRLGLRCKPANPLGSLQRSPTPLSWIKGPTSKGRERKRRDRIEEGEGRARKKGKGRKGEKGREGKAFSLLSMASLPLTCL